MVVLQIYRGKANLYWYSGLCINIPLIFFNLFEVGREKRLEHPKQTRRQQFTITETGSMVLQKQTFDVTHGQISGDTEKLVIPYVGAP